MNRKIRFLAVVFLALFLCSCHRGTGDVINGPYVPSISSPVKIRVVDVWNDTHEVFDVDVIGLLWGELDESLRKRGMLWNQQMGGQYLTLEAHIVKYKKGSMAGRLLPWYGDAVLVVQSTLKDGDRQLAAIETKHRISFGSGTFTRNAWRKVFSETSEDVVTQAIRKF
jgi:hypothetical protein